MQLNYLTAADYVLAEVIDEGPGFDPPKQLVVQGLYRYVRNPMYLGVLVLLLGEAALFESVALLQYAAIWFAVIHLVVVLYEEPALRHRFGEPYDRYCRSVRRWLPGTRFGRSGK